MNKDFLQRLKTITNQEYRDELALIEQVKQLLLDHTLAEAQDMEPFLNDFYFHAFYRLP